VVAIMVASAPARGQSAAPQDDLVQYRAPDGSTKSISKVEHQGRVADLRAMIDDLTNNRRVILTITSEPVLVTNERLHEIARWLERKGGLTALEIPGWIDDQIRKSRDMIPSLTRELEGLTTIRPATPGPAARKVEWPVPMDWLQVRATMHFTQRTVCQSRTRSPILAEDVSLELVGDASVDLVFSDGTRLPGVMIPQGLASGQGRIAFAQQQVSGVFHWRVTFNRMNDELVVSNYLVGFVPDEAGMSCDPTQLIPGQDPEDDQFPDPMNWLGTRGSVHGDYSINCSDDTRLEGKFRIELGGNGNIQVLFEQLRPPDRVPASTFFQEREDGGYAELTAAGAFGRYVWNVVLRREGNRIALPAATDLRVFPRDPAVECFVPILSNVQ
jgi:hypothetical protein